MVLPNDDLCIGIWVLEVNHSYGCLPGHDYFERQPLPGVPWRVEAINLPFLIVKSCLGIRTFDVRYVELSKASPEYIETFEELGPKIGACPICSGTLHEGRGKLQGDGIDRDFLVCRNCKFFGVVPDETNENKEEFKPGS